MKRILFALMLVCSALQAETNLLTLENKHDHDHHGHDHSTAHSYSPIGVMGSHVHKKGEWMFSYRFMYMEMEGLRDGNNRTSFSDEHVSGSGSYMMLPEKMTMKMHMLGMMYGVTDELTLGLMVPWIENDMDIRGGMMGTTEFSTHTEGVGDIKVNGMYKLWNDETNTLILNLGVSLPTGNINEHGNTPMAPSGAVLPYPMQIGSGTFDVMPGLTFSGSNDIWGWGGQAIATIRTHKNYRDYSKGNSLKLNAWLSRKITKSFATSFRVELNSWEDYDGHDDEIDPRRNMMPTADSDLRSGTRADAFLGFNYLFTEGILKNHNIGIEFGIPFYQNIDGPNLETDWTMTVGWQVAF